MGKKRRKLEDLTEIDESVWLADDDFDIDEFLDAQDWPRAIRHERWRRRAHRRLEDERDRRWLEQELSDWEEYSD